MIGEILGKKEVDKKKSDDFQFYCKLVLGSDARHFRDFDRDMSLCGTNTLSNENFLLYETLKEKNALPNPDLFQHSFATFVVLFDWVKAHKAWFDNLDVIKLKETVIKIRLEVDQLPKTV